MCNFLSNIKKYLYTITDKSINFYKKSIILYFHILFLYIFFMQFYILFYSVWIELWCVSLNCFAQLWFTCTHCHLDYMDYCRDFGDVPVHDIMRHSMSHKTWRRRFDPRFVPWFEHFQCFWSVYLFVCEYNSLMCFEQNVHIIEKLCIVLLYKYCFS